MNKDAASVFILSPPETTLPMRNMPGLHGFGGRITQLQLCLLNGDYNYIYTRIL